MSQVTAILHVVQRGADTLTNRTWAGQSFDTANGTASGAVMQEVITGGQVDVSASEVVLISLG